jgi:hypothetical protein
MFIFTSNLESVTPIIVIGIAVIAVISLGLIVVLLILQNIVSGYFSSKKFAVKSKHKVEPLTGEEKFELMVFNNNVNEARILSFGFLYRSNSIDFFDTYLKSQNLDSDVKVIITSRDFIKLEIEALLLQELVAKHNDGKVRVEPVFAYVTDIGGHIIKNPAREVRKIIYRHFKAIDDAKKAKLRAEKNEAARVKREARQAKWNEFWANFKSRLTRKPKPVPETPTQVEPKPVETLKPKAKAKPESPVEPELAETPTKEE